MLAGRDRADRSAVDKGIRKPEAWKQAELIATQHDLMRVLLLPLCINIGENWRLGVDTRDVLDLCGDVILTNGIVCPLDVCFGLD
jgi:hypothetical protein